MAWLLELNELKVVAPTVFGPTLKYVPEFFSYPLNVAVPVAADPGLLLVLTDCVKGKEPMGNVNPSDDARIIRLYVPTEPPRTPSLHAVHVLLTPAARAWTILSMWITATPAPGELVVARCRLIVKSPSTAVKDPPVPKSPDVWIPKLSITCTFRSARAGVANNAVKASAPRQAANLFNLVIRFSPPKTEAPRPAPT
jgi:hypothetical protein